MKTYPEDYYESNLQLDDFEDPTNEGAKVNDKTASVLAGQQTLFTNGTPDEYKNIKAELLDPVAKQKFIARHEQTRRDIMDDARGATVDILADSELPDQIKTTVLENANNPELGMDVGSIVRMSEQAIAAASEGESPRAEESRNFLVEAHEEVMAYRRGVQSQINSLNLDQGTVGNLVDLGEVILPYAEWLHFDRLLADLTDGEASHNLLGQQKQQLYDYLEGRPLEERALLAQRLIDTVSNNENVLLPDGNDMLTLETLERMLITGEYSNFERYFDNVTSVLDIIGVGGGLRALLKGPKAVKAGVRTLEEEASNFVPKQDPTLEGVFGKQDVVEPTPTTSFEAEAGAFKGSQEPTVDTVFREASSSKVTTEVSPLSPAEVFGQTNPDLKRKLHAAMLEDDTGEVAKAGYGTNKTEAVVKDLTPEPQLDGLGLPNKVDIEPITPEPARFQRARERSGNTILSEVEQSKIMQKVKENLANLRGVELHKSSLGIKSLPNGRYGITARYSPIDTGHRTADDALTSAEIAFRNYGLTRDNFTLLTRQGDRWVTTNEKDIAAINTLNEAGANLGKADEFSVSVDFEYGFGTDSIDLIANELDTLTTAPGWLSRSFQKVGNFGIGPQSWKQGSVQQHFLDAASTIHPQIVNAASVAVDRTYKLKRMYVEAFEDFSKPFNKLGKDRRVAMTEYIQRANLEGLALDVTDLAKQGFSQTEVRLLKKWRRANDIMWHALNQDMIQSLNARNVRMFIHKDSDTKLMGKPLSRQQANSNVYNPADNDVKTLTKTGMDDLYENGGEVFKLDEAIEVDGRMVDQIISPNTPQGGFNRKIAEGENILAYRDGYYPVMYDANHFLEMKYRDVNGNEGVKVVGSARTTKEMDELKASIRKNENLTEEQFNEIYNSRPDKKIETPGNQLFEEGQWGIATNSGLTAQRLRGERLADVRATNTNMMQGHLMDPLEAVARQVQQVSQRVAMRQYMELAKKRWLETYGRYLDLPKGADGKIDTFPKDAGGIRGKNNTPPKMVADAKTNFQYLHTLETGYINAMDSGYKAVMNWAAQEAAKFGMSKTEAALFSASKNFNPAQAARTVAFKMFISANPLRQAIIQRGQIFMLGNYNPSYSIGRMQKDWWGVTSARYSQDPKHPYWDLWKEMDDAGIIDAVDGHTLIRDDLLRLSDRTFSQRVGSAVDAPFKFTQKIGFDLAEQDVLITAWLAARDLAIKKYGKEGIKEARVKDEILGNTRAWTLNMNRAGEMPYSQNTLGVMAQFFSFRHKAFLQTLSNRNLSVKQRASLLGYTTALFGMDATIIYGLSDYLMGEEPSPEKDVVKNGLMDYVLNKSITAASGMETNLDWGDMAPSEAQGMGDLWVGMLENGVFEIIASSPASSLMFGGNPRIRDMFATSFRYVGVFDDYDDPELDTKLSDVSAAFMAMFSGANNIFKAQYALKTGQKMSGSGRISDEDVNKWEATAAMFGFRTRTEEGYRLVREAQFSQNTFEQSDFDIWYGALKRHLARRGETTTGDFDTSQRVLSEAWRVFSDDYPRAVEMLKNKLESDASKADHQVIMGILNNAGMVTSGETWNLINKLPPSPERDMVVQQMKFLEGAEDDN